MKLSSFSKKTIAALTLSTVIALGTAAPALVSAAGIEKDKPAFERHHKMTPEKMSARLGISQVDLEKYQAAGLTPRAIGHAALLSKVSGKSIDEVIILKTKDNTWKDVTSALGVTKEQIKSARHSMMAERLAQKGDIDKATILNLLNQGYQIRDIMMAGKLSKTTNKTIDEVLNMKRINNTWHDVATELGVTLEKGQHFSRHRQ